MEISQKVFLEGKSFQSVFDHELTLLNRKMTNIGHAPSLGF